MVAILEYKIDGKTKVYGLELIEGLDYQAQIDMWASDMEVTILAQVIVNPEED